jgi:hypothetical protein
MAGNHAASKLSLQAFAGSIFLNQIERRERTGAVRSPVGDAGFRGAVPSQPGARSVNLSFQNKHVPAASAPR